MNMDEFRGHWAELDGRVKDRLVDFARYPTERNSCYITGYLLGACEGKVITQGQYHYLLALTGQMLVASSYCAVVKQASRDEFKKEST